MNLLDLIPGREFRKCGPKHGGEYHGSCPFCGDGGKGEASDRFHVWPGQGPTGRYWCRMCDKSGDAIQYLRDTEGLGYREACERLGVVMESAPAERPKQRTGFRPARPTRPGEKWQEHAAKFVDFCHARLLENGEQLAWLAGRGIVPELIERYRLGWNPSHAWRERPAWGLPVERKDDGRPKKLWLPRGLVIPLVSGGTVLRLRIRQPDGDPRYFVVPGSSREPLISRADQAMVIVESELDAILLDGVAGDAVGIAALGNDTAKPTEDLHASLQAAEHISVSLDSDTPRRNQVTGRMEIPGGKASRWWLEHFPHAERVPVVGGKDPGDAYRAGVDLRTWVLAGLPPYFQVRARMRGEKKQEAGPRPQAQQQEGDGAVDEGPTERIITLKDGREFLVTEDQAEWRAAVDAGRLVFSGNELQRLRPVLAGMDKEERRRATALVLDIKELFPGAYIRDGRVLS